MTGFKDADALGAVRPVAVLDVAGECPGERVPVDVVSVVDIGSGRAAKPGRDAAQRMRSSQPSRITTSRFNGLDSRALSALWGRRSSAQIISVRA